MSDSKIETSSYSSSTVERRSSPIVTDTIVSDDVFHAKRSGSRSDINHVQNFDRVNYYSTADLAANLHGFTHLEAANRSNSSSALNHLVGQQLHHAVPNEFNQIAGHQYQYGVSTDLNQIGGQQLHRTLSTDLNQIAGQQYQRSSSTDLAQLSAAQQYERRGSAEMNRSINQQLQRRGSTEFNQFAADQYQQSLATDFNQYPINHDPNPELIRRGNTDRVTYRQDVAIRYLQPPTPPPPGPVIIREIRAPQAPDAPPLVVRQRPPAPVTPPPMVIREQPPLPPPIEPARVVNKLLPAPPPPPRSVIIERQAPLPPKPQPVIIEKWLPYPPTQERRVVVEHAAPCLPRPAQKNKIITWDAPHVDLVKNVRELGTIRADPQMYVAQYGSHLASSEYVMNTMAKFGLGNNYVQMMQLQSQPHISLMDGNQQTSISYGQRRSSSSYQSQVGDQYNFMEKHTSETRLPDGRRQFHSSISGSDEQEILRQASLVQ